MRSSVSDNFRGIPTISEDDVEVKFGCRKFRKEWGGQVVNA